MNHEITVVAGLALGATALAIAVLCLDLRLARRPKCNSRGARLRTYLIVNGSLRRQR